MESSTAAALAADIDVLTGVAVAFPRSPMVTAQVAWELHEATGGNFRLGLGTQVRTHIVRRYGVDAGMYSTEVNAANSANQALLDWLAVEFVDAKWDLKHMVRLIVNSDTYMRSSVATPAQVAADLLKWKPVIEKAGIPFRLKVPHKAFHRNIGALAGVKVSPDGRVVSDAEWNAKVGEWLPTGEDRAYVASLMGRVVEPGKFANWIAPPVMGINRQPVDFEYVRFN